MQLEHLHLKKERNGRQQLEHFETEDDGLHVEKIQKNVVSVRLVGCGFEENSGIQIRFHFAPVRAGVGASICVSLEEGLVTVRTGDLFPALVFDPIGLMKAN